MTDTVNLYEPDLECLAWAPTPHVIGTQGHNHICRLDHAHDGDHTCIKCGQEFR